MPLGPEAIETYVDAVSQALALPIAPEHRPGVLGYMALASGFADIVQAVVLEPHDEPATCFVPVAPPGRTP